MKKTASLNAFSPEKRSKLTLKCNSKKIIKKTPVVAITTFFPIED